jgi:drug/metabolite transporter (DMT)-like permease
MATRQVGIISALLAAVLFGASTPFAKYLLAHATPLVLAALLYLGAGIGLGAGLLVRRWTRPDAGEYGGIARDEFPWLLSAILAGGVAGPFLLMLGLTSTPATTASLLLNLEGVFTALLAWFAFKEHFDRRLVIGMVLIVVAGVMLSWQGPPASGPAGGSLAIVGYGLSLALFVIALRHLGTARTGAYFSLAPFLGALISLTVLREAPDPIFWIAAALMGAGIWLHLSERHAHHHAHAPLAHRHRHIHDEHHQHAHDFHWAGPEPHTHPHRHAQVMHSHPHYPDLHHRHDHMER